MIAPVILTCLLIFAHSSSSQLNILYFPGEKPLNTASIRGGPVVSQPIAARGCQLTPQPDIRTHSKTCSLQRGTVAHEGRCRVLLRREPCPPGLWLVLDRATSYGVCKRPLCKNSNEAFLAGVGCVKTGSSPYCPHPTLRVMINEYGEGECECPQGAVYHPRAGGCYVQFTRGPCPPGQVVQMVHSPDNRGSRGECVPALCTQEREVPLKHDCSVAQPYSKVRYECHELGTAGLCEQGFVTVDRVSSEVVCSDSVPYSILDILSVCHVGSMRDNNWRCRREFSATNSALTTISSFAPTMPPGDYDGKPCPQDYILLGDVCRYATSGE